MCIDKINKLYYGDKKYIIEDESGDKWIYTIYGRIEKDNKVSHVKNMPDKIEGYLKSKYKEVFQEIPEKILNFQKYEYVIDGGLGIKYEIQDNNNTEKIDFIIYEYSVSNEVTLMCNLNYNTDADNIPKANKFYMLLNSNSEELTRLKNELDSIKKSFK